MKTVIVSGASRGIGAAIAQGFAETGHRVYAGMREPSEWHALEGVPGDIRPVRMDVTKPLHVEDVVHRVLRECDAIDLVVNNAGVAWFAPAEEMSETLLRTTFETNFFGAVNLTRAVLPSMRQRGAGSIVMISTLPAAVGLPLESAYCASKRALEAYAESLAQEVGRFGIRVGIVQPGITEGGLSNSAPDPKAPGRSAYAPLLEHTFDYYAEAQGSLDPASGVVDAVRALASGTTDGPRLRLGPLAAAIEEIEQLPYPERAAAVRTALGVDWWNEREAQEEV